MSVDPHDPRFWSEEASLLREIFAGLTGAAYLAGAQSGLGLLPVGYQQLINWDVFNQAALDFLHAYNLETVDGITETTRNQVIQLIDDWVRSGDPLEVLQTQIATLPTFSDARAASIAVTEVTRIYAEGNLSAWRSTGVVQAKRWMTARDEHVCPQCGPLDRQIVHIDTNFEIPEDQQTPELARQILLGKVDQFAHAPPKHVNCRCWLQPIVSEAGFERELERILA